jgi:hypothetical protein
VSWALRLIRDRLDAGAGLRLGAAPRVLWVRDGKIVVEDASGQRDVAAGAAWYGSGTAAVTTGGAGTEVWRWELMTSTLLPPASSTTGVESLRLLEHPVEIDPSRAWLMRCDRVEFAPGGVALPHGHKGGGIRCLVTGSLEVTVGDEPPRLMQPGGAWFESGREPVLARSSAQEPTAFIRVSILPREIRGQSSIVYVNPDDAAGGKPRRYTVYVDEPVDLPPLTAP